LKIELTNDEINFIQQVLGELPSKTGAFLVMNSIAKQVQEAAQFEQVKQSAIQGDQNV
jgi:K+/H+ antiporter YhaU regulatory subunit KhtT